MTIQEILNYVDMIKPNGFTSVQKMLWLNEVEGMVQADVLLLAPSSMVNYVLEAEWTGKVSFPDKATMVCASSPGFHVGGTVTISELVDAAAANNVEAKILAVSSDGLTLTFAEGTFTAVTQEQVASLQFNGSETEMLVSQPHSKIYYTYLMAMIDFANGEYAKYQNTMTLFNSFFVNFSTWFRETYHPADGEAEALGYYLSAYAIAVNHGYEGTEEAWLASLQGDRAVSTEEAQSAAAAAASSASAAATSETNADSSASAASASASIAVSAKNDAIAAKDTATAAATNAAASAETASTAKTAAEIAQSAAETAEGNAATEATNAVASATAASNSAVSAGTSATNATSSASAASASAADAASSASAAATSAMEAEVNYNVDGDRVGFKKGDEAVYTYTDHLTGETGNGIASVVRTSGDGSPGTTDTYTITMTSGATATFTIYNGADAGIIIDSVMSATSTNPVQNRVVQAALDGKANNLIDDTYNYYAAETVEGTLQEIGGHIVSINGSLSDKADLVDGTVPASQLPSYVDDVLEVTAYASLPGTGESGKIYITLDTNKTYRWSGSGYTEISESLALGETSSTACRGDRGATAYNHSQTTGNPHGTTATNISITDSGSYFTATTTEGALQEIGSELDGLAAALEALL